jgi:hypothetical protein
VSYLEACATSLNNPGDYSPQIARQKHLHYWIIAEAADMEAAGHCACGFECPKVVPKEPQEEVTTVDHEDVKGTCMDH